MKEAREFYLKYKFFIWPITSGLASVVILVLLVIPQFLAFLNMRTEIQTTQERSGKLEVKAQGLQQFDGAAVQKSLNMTSAVLPTDRDVPQAASVLQDIVARSGVTLKSISYSASTKGEKGNRFQLNISVLGQANTLRELMINLEDASRVFQVRSINVQFQYSGAMVEATIPLDVYYDKGDKSTVSSLDSDIPRLNEKQAQLLSRLAKIVGGDLSQGGEATSSSIPLGKQDLFN